MRITFIHASPDMTGGTRVVAIYAQALARLGHQVTLISLPPRPISLRQKLRNLRDQGQWDFGRRRIRSHFDRLEGVDHRVLERWRAPTDADVPDADVVIATWWETAEWVSALGASKGAKVYFVQHHEVHPNLPAARVRATYRLPMHKIVIAQWLADLMASEYGDTVVDLVPNSVDRDQFHAPPRGRQSVPTLGFMYATAAYKGLSTTLAALERLRARRPELRIVCFGAKPLHKDYPLPAGAEFIHAPAQDRIRRIYAQCDVWLSASRSEGFNLPAMEAMACRTPIVATRTGWPEEALVSGENGVLVEVDDVDAIVRGAEWVLGLEDAAWRALSTRAFATASQGSWGASAKQFEQALEHARRREALLQHQPVRAETRLERDRVAAVAVSRGQPLQGLPGTRGAV